MVALIARGREDDVGVSVNVDHVDHALFSILSFSLITLIEKYHLQIHINILSNSKCLYTVSYPQS